MRKIFKISALFLALASLFSCQKEFVDTDQLAGPVAIGAIAPNPIIRGSELRIVGSNLGNVSKVQIPGVADITDIQHIKTNGKISEIRIIVPLEGPVEGKVTVVTKDGQMASSKFDLTYIEGMEFHGFTTEQETVMPGDVITIEGEYINLIQEVIFTSGDETVTVTGDAISEITRHSAKVVVPNEATTGVIKIGDVNELIDKSTIPNVFPSTDDLVVGLPTIDVLDEGLQFKPGDKITVTGEHLLMIKGLSFTDNVASEIITEESDDTKIVFEVPETAVDGLIKFYTYANVAIEVGEIAMVKPEATSVSEEAVKAGADLKIYGTDLDLITSVTVPGAGEVDFIYVDPSAVVDDPTEEDDSGDDDGGEIVTESEESPYILINIPAIATEGEIVLTAANGDATSIEFTLTHPTVTNIAPLDIMAGEQITVNGNNLDLITSITLGGNPVDFVCEEGVITITTSATAVSGKLVLKLANGEELNPEDIIAVSYDSFIIINEMPAAEHIGAIVTLKGTNFMMVENIFVGEAKVEKYTHRADDIVSFIMPYNKIGSYSLKFKLFDGSEEIYPTPIEVLLEQSIVKAWEGNMVIDWGTNKVSIPASLFEGVQAGAKLRVSYTQVDQQWDQAQFNYGDFTTISFTDPSGVVFSGTLVPTDIYGWFEDGILDRVDEMILTQEILDNIQAKKAVGGDFNGAGIIIQGSGLTFTKVEIISEIPQEVTIWEGNEDLGSWSAQPYIGADGGLAELAPAPGTKMTVYFTPTGDDWKFQIYEGHWGPQYFEIGPDTPGVVEAKKFEFELTAEMITALSTPGGWGGIFVMQGQNVIITKLTIG